MAGEREAGPLFFAQGVRSTLNGQGGSNICPRCGAAYPSPGTCNGYGDDKHEPTEVGRA